MEQIVECLIAGGPQHGLMRRQLWDPQYPAPPVIASADGAVCIAAAQRHATPDSSRFLLLHPHATGRQILAMMMELYAQPGRPAFPCNVGPQASIDMDYALADFD